MGGVTLRDASWDATDFGSSSLLVLSGSSCCWCSSVFVSWGTGGWWLSLAPAQPAGRTSENITDWLNHEFDMVMLGLPVISQSIACFHLACAPFCHLFNPSSMHLLQHFLNPHFDQLPSVFFCAGCKHKKILRVPETFQTSMNTNSD